MADRISWKDLNSLPILEVAKRLGIDVRRNKALCFTGHDKEPSLSFKLPENYWKCFGCNKGGDVIQLVKDVLNCDPAHAAQWLKKEFLMHDSMPFKGPRPKILQPKKIEPSGTSEPDPEVYEWLLAQCTLEDDGRTYLLNRGYSSSTIDHFRVGEISNPSRVFYAAQKKWTMPRLIKAGLVNVSPDGEARFLWFLPALIFPFITNDRVTYLQGRMLSDKAKVRWMGLKNIKKQIYNFDHLKRLERGDDVYLCEGVTDTLAAYELGINAVGILGAHSFNEEWLKLLAPFRIYIAFDSDKAGLEGGRKIRTLFKKAGISAISISMDGHKDLAEYLQSTRRNP